MSGLPIRVRLTAVFALAMVVVLSGAGLFVYTQLRGDLDETVDEGLAARADAVAALARQGQPSLGGRTDAAISDPEEAFAQIADADGRVIASRGGAVGRVLPPDALAAATRGAVVAEHHVAGIEGRARILGRPLPNAPGAAVVVGQSLGDRDEALAALAASFAIGGPVAVLLASLLGYGLATAALRPVEAMRRHAASVSLSGERDALPLPDARDEVRRLGETLNDMLDRLHGSFERERRFVADASHELRTPIAVLKTELEALLRQAGHDAELREALQAAAGEADHVARLADDLLVLARASGGRLPVHSERVDAADALEAVRERFAGPATQQHRRIEVHAPAALGIRADPLRLRQALANLVDNALRHGAGEIGLSARAVGDRIVIDVTDRGTGFPGQLRGRAFERFSRGDEARTRGGAGLGLAIVRAIAEAHGGHAEILDDLDGGAHVRLHLPADEPADRPGGSQPGFSTARHPVESNQPSPEEDTR